MAIKTEAVQPSSTVKLIGFDWLFTLAASWLIGGLFLDGWAHNHNMVDTSFFTPWHAVFYSGFAAVALVVAGKILTSMRQGLTFRQAIPVGYELSTLGVLIFGFGGGFDLFWHTVFGIEKGIEALYSPSHLTLALGMALIVTGPLRSAWATKPTTEGNKPTLLAFLPVLISLLLFLSVLTFFTQSANPFVNTVTLEGQVRPTPRLQADIYTVASSSSMLFETAILMVVVLMGMKRWQLPFGSLTLLLLVNGLMMCTQGDQYRFIPGAVAAGLLGDILIHTLNVSRERKVSLRIFAFVFPAVFWGLYILSLSVTSQIWWTTHLWTGVVVETGVVGLLLSLLL